MKEHKLISIKDLKPAKYNPRMISDAELAGLKKSMNIYGDLSGIVWNARSGNLVSGHQRMRGLQEEHGDGLRLETDPPRIVAPNGSEFGIRIVDWDLPTERAANIAANSKDIQGHFDDEKLSQMLAQMEADGADVSLTMLSSDTIAALLAEGTDPDLSGESQLGEMEYRIIITCKSESEQLNMLERFEKEGIECRALIS